MIVVAKDKEHKETMQIQRVILPLLSPKTLVHRINIGSPTMNYIYAGSVWKEGKMGKNPQQHNTPSTVLRGDMYTPAKQLISTVNHC